MTKIKFESDLPIAKSSFAESKKETKGLIGLVIRLSGGKVQNEKQAQYILVGVIILLIILYVLVVPDGPIEPVDTFDIHPDESIGSPDGMM